MAADDVLTRRDGRILRITINRPQKRNPLSREVLAIIERIFDDMQHDAELACVVLTGAGDACFASGGDLRELDAMRSEAQAAEVGAFGRAALDAVRRCPVPVIAMLNGDALGGGAELAVACDWRAMRDGSHIGFIHGRLNITSAWGGSIDLIDLIGPARALRMTARCELLPADHALQWGLADLVASASELGASVDAFIAPLLQQSPLALRGCKASVLAAREGRSRAERHYVETKALMDTWVHPDHWAVASTLLDDRHKSS